MDTNSDSTEKSTFKEFKDFIIKNSTNNGFCKILAKIVEKEGSFNKYDFEDDSIIINNTKKNLPLYKLVKEFFENDLCNNNYKVSPKILAEIYKLIKENFPETYKDFPELANENIDRIEKSRILGNEKKLSSKVSSNYILLMAGSDVMYHHPDLPDNKYQKLISIPNIPIFIDYTELANYVENVTQIIVEENYESFLNFFQYEFNLDDPNTAQFYKELSTSLIIIRGLPNGSVTKECGSTYVDKFIKQIVSSDSNIKIIGNADIDVGGYNWTQALPHITHVLLPNLDNLSTKIIEDYGKNVKEKNMAIPTNPQKPYDKVFELCQNTNNRLMQEKLIACNDVFKLQLYKFGE